MMPKKTILIAPLHWGLGHATRCIPIINALINFNFNVIIASDGGALLLLQKEFPLLKTIELPSYQIEYPKKGKNFKLNLLLKLPAIRKAISEEKKIIEELVNNNSLDGIISDNRFGVHHENIPSVFITHQIKVLSGSTTFISSKIHHNIIKKFDECWVPDIESKINLSGKIGHVKSTHFKVKYIGVLSRMKKLNLPMVYDIIILLSGPEPQRTLLEVQLLEIFKESKYKVLMVRGVVENNQIKHTLKNITIVNFMATTELEKAINESDLVVSRSGYTTIMDLTVLEKKAFLIPTPGQFEQEYLAKRLKKLELVASCRQDNFNLDKLKDIKDYKGLKKVENQIDFKELFSLFKGK
ncbi:MAG: glycosyltransferase [Flavobacteriaceae bacterium]|nr:glycosyltransferase [Flavobacteriaceae bacterium]